MWIPIRHMQMRHMKALWHTFNGLKVYWHVSAPIRSIFAAPLRKLRLLVSTDTQLFDSLSRLCHVHVAHTHTHTHKTARRNLQALISNIVADPHKLAHHLSTSLLCMDLISTYAF